MIPAIVLSSHTIGLSVIRSLGIMGVPVTVLYYEKTDMGYVSKYVKEKIFTPHPENYEDEFIKVLLDYGKHRKEKGLLIAADDATLVTVSKNKELLEKFYILTCNNWNITEKFIDKIHTYALAELNEVPSPKTAMPRSIEEAKSLSKNFEYPLLVKPSRSHSYYEKFKEKMVKVDNENQMLLHFSKAHNLGLDIMLQEYIPGDDSLGVNYNSYFWKGEVLVEFTAQKVRLSPPGFGIPRVVISKHIPQIIEPSYRILKALQFTGYSCMEYKKDPRNGVYKLMEVNGRHNRSGLLALSCGLNFPWIEYKHLIQKEKPSAKDFTDGIYWIDEFKDSLYSAKFFKKEKITINKFLSPYLKPHVFSVFDIKDIWPFLKRSIDMVRIVVRFMIPGKKNRHSQ